MEFDPNDDDFMIIEQDDLIDDDYNEIKEVVPKKQSIQPLNTGEVREYQKIREYVDKVYDFFSFFPMLWCLT